MVVIEPQLNEDFIYGAKINENNEISSSNVLQFIGSVEASISGGGRMVNTSIDDTGVHVVIDMPNLGHVTVTLTSVDIGTVSRWLAPKCEGYMSFSEALELLKQRKRVTNRKLLGNRTWLEVHDTFNVAGEVNDMPGIYVCSPKDYNDDTKDIFTKCLRMPWQACTVEILDDHWVEVVEVTDDNISTIWWKY